YLLTVLTDFVTYPRPGSTEKTKKYETSGKKREDGEKQERRSQKKSKRKTVPQHAAGA
ncbi:hypothetical protein TRV_03372, partial [Trichophyton verrucosum HKI 0517]